MIKLPNDTVKTTTREFIRPIGEQDNITLPSTLDDYKDIIKDLSVEDIETIMHPKVLSRLEEEYLDIPNCLQHMPPSEIFTLCDQSLTHKISQTQS